MKKDFDEIGQLKDLQEYLKKRGFETTLKVHRNNYPNRLWDSEDSRLNYCCEAKGNHFYKIDVFNKKILADDEVVDMWVVFDKYMEDIPEELQIIMDDNAEVEAGLISAVDEDLVNVYVS